MILVKIITVIEIILFNIAIFQIGYLKGRNAGIEMIEEVITNGIIRS